MSPVDIVFLLILLLALVRGYSRGLLGTAAGYLAPVAGVMLAADWSAPARDWLARLAPALPDALLSILAPVAVFVVIVIVIRVAAAIFARLLGVGLSLPSRIVAAAASLVLSAVVLGAVVLMVRQLQPDKPERPGQSDEAGDVLLSPFANLLTGLDRRFAESRLAAPLAELASTVVSEAVAHGEASPLVDRDQIEDAARKAAAAAAEALGRRPAGDERGTTPAERRDESGPKPPPRASHEPERPPGGHAR